MMNMNAFIVWVWLVDLYGTNQRNQPRKIKGSAF